MHSYSKGFSRDNFLTPLSCPSGPSLLGNCIVFYTSDCGVVLFFPFFRSVSSNRDHFIRVIYEVGDLYAGLAKTESTKVRLKGSLLSDDTCGQVLGEYLQHRLEKMPCASAEGLKDQTRCKCNSVAGDKLSNEAFSNEIGTLDQELRTYCIKVTILGQTKLEQLEGAGRWRSFY